VRIRGTGSPDVDDEEARRYPGESAVSVLGKKSAAHVVARQLTFILKRQGSMSSTLCP